MVKLTHVFLCLILLCNTALATKYGASDAGTDIVAKGGNIFIRSFVDGMY